MGALYLVLSAIDCAEQYAEAFSAGYARGLWHGGGVVILVVWLGLTIMYFAKRRK